MRTLFIVVLLASSAGACGGARDEGMPTERHPVTPDWAAPSASSAPAASSAAPAPAEAAEGVVLVSPGAPPRRALRYVFHPGTVEPIQVDMHVALGIEMDGHKSPLTETPGVRMHGVIRADHLTPQGNLAMGYLLDAVDLTDTQGDPTLRQKVLESTRKLVGMAVEMEVTPRGEVTSGKVSMPAGADRAVSDVVDQTQNAIRDLVAPLPNEPVGVGATWTAKRTVHMKFVLQNELTFRLARLDGDRGVLESTVLMSAPPQPLDTPGTDATITLQSMKGKGKGKSDFDLQHLVRTSEVQVQADTTMSVEAQGSKHLMHMQMESEIRLAPVAK